MMELFFFSQAVLLKAFVYHYMLEMRLKGESKVSVGTYKFSPYNTHKYTAMYKAQPWLRVQRFNCTEKISSYGYSISL